MKILPLILLMLLIISCGSPSTAKNDGSGSEIVGVVQTSDQQAASAKRRGLISVNLAQVFLFKAGHFGTDKELPEMRTSLNGLFKVKTATSGDWFVYAFDSTTNLSRIKRINVKGDGKQIDVGSMETVKPATVNCTIYGKDSTPITVKMSYEIYILGTRTFGKGNQDKLDLTLENIPAGERLTVHFKLLTPYPWSSEQTIDVPQGGTTDLKFILPFKLTL